MGNPRRKVDREFTLKIKGSGRAVASRTQVEMILLDSLSALIEWLLTKNKTWEISLEEVRKR